MFSYKKSPILSTLALTLVFSLGFSFMVNAQHFTETRHTELGFDASRLERLSHTLQEYVDQDRISGGVTLVMRHGQPVFFEAFGMRDREAGDAMQRDAIFRIASQTKAIVATAVMLLQEEGKLLISDPVGKYLPEYMETHVMTDTGIVPASRPITIRDLLTHSAGIGYGWGPAAQYWREAGFQTWYLADRDEPIREIVRRMASLPFDAHPGERFVYGYANDILGAMIEVISNQPLDVFLHERIFIPLQMHDTHFFLPKEKAHRLAVVYSATDNGLERAPDPGMGIGQGHYTDGPRKCFSGGAGLVSTANDYGRFLQMMLNGGELEGQRLLSPRTVQLMIVNHLTEIDFRPGLGIGLGFDVVTDLGAFARPGAVGDFGWGGAYHSTYWVSPQDGLVVVFLSQLTPAGGSDIHGKLRSLIYQAIMD